MTPSKLVSNACERRQSDSARPPVRFDALHTSKCRCPSSRQFPVDLQFTRRSATAPACAGSSSLSRRDNMDMGVNCDRVDKRPAGACEYRYSIVDHREIGSFEPRAEEDIGFTLSAQTRPPCQSIDIFDRAVKELTPGPRGWILISAHQIGEGTEACTIRRDIHHFANMRVERSRRVGERMETHESRADRQFLQIELKSAGSRRRLWTRAVMQPGVA
jgi:hypothetical protein